MKLSVVIPNYNGTQHLKTCIDSIYRQEYKDFEVIIVDDGSIDDSVNYVRKNFKRIKLIELEKNKGFANACNEGIRESKGEYVLILNNDTKFKDGVFNDFIMMMDSDKELGAVCGKVISFENKLESMGIQYSVSGLSEDNKSENEAFTFQGCCVMFRKKALEDIKIENEYYDSHMEIFSDEADIGFRLRKRGWDVKVDKGTRVFHMHGGSIKSASDRSMYLTHRNRLIVMLKNLSTGFIIRHIIPILTIQIMIAGKYTLKGKPHLILKSYFNILKNFKKIMRKRKIIRKRQTVPDNEVNRFVTRKWIIW